MKTKVKLTDMKNIRKEKGITLVALVVTIVVLLILAGITITLVFSENGIIKKAISSKEANEEGTVKEEIALALLQMRTDKYDEEYNLDNIKEWLPEYLDKGQLGDITIENGKLLGEYKGYEFEINNKFDISYIGKVTGIRITYTLNPEGYTNGNITLTVSATSTEGTIESIEGPEGLTQNQDGTYTITKNGTYKFTATDSAKNEKEIDIEINTIDNLAPKAFTPIIENLKASTLTIVANTEDDEPKTEADGIKSGIDRYEYYLTKKGETTPIRYESTQGEYPVSNLEPATEYTIYVIAYDKANNPKTSQNVTITTASHSLTQLVVTGTGIYNSYDPDTNEYYNNPNGVIKDSTNKDVPFDLYSDSEKTVSYTREYKENLSLNIDESALGKTFWVKGYRAAGKYTNCFWVGYYTEGVPVGNYYCFSTPYGSSQLIEAVISGEDAIIYLRNGQDRQLACFQKIGIRD